MGLRIICLSLLSTWFFACGGARLIRIESPIAGAAVRPEIKELKDLGSMPMRVSGELDTKHSDGRFSPGEWVALRGHGLHAAKTVQVNGQQIPVQGYLEDGGILVRLTRNLNLRKENKLGLKTAAGGAERDFSASSYIVATDTDGNRVCFLRTQMDGDAVDDDRPTIDQTRALHHKVSNDGAFLYSLGLDSREKSDSGIGQVGELAVIHLNAKDEPEVVARIRVDAPTQFSGMAISKDHLLAISTREHVILVDVAEPTQPKPLGTVALPSGDKFYSRPTFNRDGTRIALLEIEKSLAVVDVTDPKAGKFVHEIELAPKGTSVGLDLVLDPQEPGRVWALMGPNLRTTSRAVKGDFPAAGNARELVAVEWAATPVLGPRVAMNDDILPLFVKASGPSLLVSGVSKEMMSFKGAKFSVDGAKKLLGWVKDSVQLGRIQRVDVSQNARTSGEELRAVQLIFEAATDDTGWVAYSGMRLGARFSMPYVGVNWGIGVKDMGFVSLRKLDAKYFLPPYTYGQVSLQAD